MRIKEMPNMSKNFFCKSVKKIVCAVGSHSFVANKEISAKDFLIKILEANRKCHVFQFDLWKK